MSANLPSAESLLAAGDPAAALRVLQGSIRAHAADPKLRVFLFQLLCVLAQWQRALDQLKVCAELDAGTLAMVSTYRAAIHCEAVREQVFAGKATPHVFGPPTAWVALLAQALVAQAQGAGEHAAALREQAFEAAPASSGQLNDQPFAWIADADSRLGPVLEVLINGRYGWLPFAHVHQIDIDPVTDLRDLVWAPARIEFINGGDTVALLPVRYAGIATDSEAALQLARRSAWQPLSEGPAGGQFSGLGQRLVCSDTTELGLLEVRRIVINNTAAEPAAAAC